MDDRTTCESCGVPIESGHYCARCTTARGELQPFDERFERMVAWHARRDPAASRSELEAPTLEHMSSMPAWPDQPARRRPGLTRQHGAPASAPP